MPFNVHDLKKSKYITQKDCDPPIRVTIIGDKEENMAMDGADPDFQWTILFKEIDKPFVVNATNCNLIAAITGKENSKDWVGCVIVLYVDPTISYRGKVTGGVRCRASKRPEDANQNIPEPHPDIVEDPPPVVGNKNPDYVGENPEPIPEGSEIPF